MPRRRPPSAPTVTVGTTPAPKNRPTGPRNACPFCGTGTLAPSGATFTHEGRRLTRWQCPVCPYSEGRA